jgi:phosphate regulon transcriptional regulator PhoB
MNYHYGEGFRAIAMKRILIIEDDKDIVELVRYNLEKEGFRVSAAEDGATGLALAKSSPPDLLVLDLMLPKLPGLEICKELRRNSGNRLPILMLTARGDEADRIVGLEIGADDYVSKPFSPRELVARVKALLRRSEPSEEQQETPIEVDGLTIDPGSYRVSHLGRPVPLSTLEFRLLAFLASHPNKVFSRDRLLDAVWGTERFVTPRSVDVYIRRLREKIEPDPENPAHLKTVRGTGYLFESSAT